LAVFKKNFFILIYLLLTIHIYLLFTIYTLRLILTIMTPCMDCVIGLYY